VKKGDNVKGGSTILAHIPDLIAERALEELEVETLV
jgi:hypothetical protein